MVTNNEEIAVESQKSKTTKQKLTEMEQKMETIRQITSLFNMERYIYISICGFAGVLVLINAVVMLVEHDRNPASLTLLFGAGGLIAVSASRLMYMWNRVVSIIFEQSDLKGVKNNGSN